MRVAAVALIMLLMAAGSASAQMDTRDAIALQNQILELRQQMLQLQRNGVPSAPPPRGGGGGSDGGLTAQLLDRVSTLEDQVRDLRGQVDRVTNQQQRQAEDLNKQIADLTFAMQNGRGAAAAPSSPPPSVLGGAPSAGPPSLGVLGGPSGGPPRTAELALQEANAALARRDYTAAEAAAREVIAKRGPRSADAQFVLAQAELGERNYQQAAPDFYDAYNRSRTGARAPDALLGVANALLALGDKASACDALAKLRAEFPQPRPDIREGEAAARSRAACR